MLSSFNLCEEEIKKFTLNHIDQFLTWVFIIHEKIRPSFLINSSKFIIIWIDKRNIAIIIITGNKVEQSYSSAVYTPSINLQRSL